MTPCAKTRDKARGTMDNSGSGWACSLLARPYLALAKSKLVWNV